MNIFTHYSLIAQIPPVKVADAFDQHHSVTYFSTLSNAGPLDTALFLLLIVASIGFVVLCFRRFPFTAAYCSDLLVLALMPFIFCAVSTYLRLLGVIAIEPISGLWDGDWFGALRRTAAPLHFGILFSITALSIYSLLYAFSRRYRNA